MSWQTVARRDLLEAARSRTTWLLLGVLLVLFLLFARFEGDSVAEFLDGIATLLQLVVPLLALALGYNAIIKERIGGNIALTLSLPHSRKDVVLGKFVSRAVVILGPVLGALVVAGGVAAVLVGYDPLLVRYPWFLAVTALLGLAFLGAAVGLSLTTRVHRRGALGAFGIFVLFVVLWDLVVYVLVLVLHRFVDLEVYVFQPSWSYLAHLLSPTEAYSLLLRVGLDLERAGRYTGPDVPWYVDWWTALGVLVLWTVLPVALGYARFRREDV